MGSILTYAVLIIVVVILNNLEIKVENRGSEVFFQDGNGGKTRDN